MPLVLFAFPFTKHPVVTEKTRATVKDIVAKTLVGA